VSPLLVALAAGATAGAVVALAARDGRIAVLGATVALILSPLVAEPSPEPPLLAVRVLGGLLAGYLLWAGLRDSSAATRGPAFGAAALGLAAVTGFIAGAAGHGLQATPIGPAAAEAAGTAIIVIALIPVIRAREAFRLALGVLLLLLGATLLRVGLAGSPDPLETFATAAALALVAGAGMAVAGLVYGDVGDFEFRAPEPEPVRRRPTDEAHRLAAAPAPDEAAGERDTADDRAPGDRTEDQPGDERAPGDREPQRGSESVTDEAPEGPPTMGGGDPG
jgi:hypothetical protein